MCRRMQQRMVEERRPCLSYHRCLLWAALCVMMVLIPAISPAQSLKDKQAELEALQESATEARQKRAVTQARKRKIAAKADALRKEVTEKAAAIRVQENRLATLGQELKELYANEAGKHEAVTARRKHFSQMASAAWTLQQRPRMAVWLMPDQARQRALTSRAIHVTTDTLRQELTSLNNKLQTLKQMRSDIVTKQKRSEQLRQTLQARRDQLQASLDKQQALLGELEGREADYTQRLQRITRKAQSLRQLIASLEERKARDERLFAHIRPIPKPASLGGSEGGTRTRSFAARKGALALPAEGVITGRYGQQRGDNDRLKGLEIKTVSGAVVSNPHAGEVLFTGPFLEYGKMVIIRHSRDYHTLVAGLSRINVSVGQFLLEDAPIGVMGKQNHQRQLYLELRKQSETINPELWFAIEKRSYATR